MADDEVGKSRHECIMRAFGPNIQTGEYGPPFVHSTGRFRESHIVRTVTLSRTPGSQAGTVLGAPEVIATLIDTGRSSGSDTPLPPGPMAAALAALDILLSQPDLLGRARARAVGSAATAHGPVHETGRPAGAVVPVVSAPQGAALSAAATGADRVAPCASVDRSCLRLTARANLSSDDPAVIKVALTAVAEKVRA
ncbi:hypothetical protein ACIBHX_16130 [Nonomuraea sp. NPDC050536]|uniref:hypothetical protein n=1 Tax=Nonomuraea sp. NPDC050536 TaxID=3364366 RepID=UPI0037C96823